MVLCYISIRYSEENNNSYSDPWNLFCFVAFLVHPVTQDATVDVYTFQGSEHLILNHVCSISCALAVA